MIQSNPNPRMTEQEVKNFRDKLRQTMTNSFTPKERKTINGKVKEMKRIARNIIKNNGGKNPILGY
jgi:hypothetical protein